VAIGLVIHYRARNNIIRFIVSRTITMHCGGACFLQVADSTDSRRSPDMMSVPPTNNAKHHPAPPQPRSNRHCFDYDHIIHERKSKLLTSAWRNEIWN